MPTVKEALWTSLQETVTLTEEEAYRLKRLHEKQTATRFEVAFCGHFSAGKSTILNTLLGAEVLPTSPIPTSANIISIQNGELCLSIEGNDQQKKEWVGEIPWQQVREWGMNGNEIKSMTMTLPLPFLGDFSAILDTPGVDSTDDSHQAVTVEQLYTTDFIVYVMDYNHVQSETNLYFLKQLSKEKKPIMIIINQIDKHNEAEISIGTFQQSIEQVFSRWEIEYIGMYFTSMKNPTHPLNEFASFERHIKGLLYHSKPLKQLSEERLTSGLMKAVESRLAEEQQEAIDEIVSNMKDDGYQVSDLEEREKVEASLKEIKQAPKKTEERFEHEMNELFKNVTLFPYTTTDLTRAWLESVQPSFKVGLLFSKKKTKEEQDTRLQKAIEDLQDKVKSLLVFHIRSYFQKVDRVLLSNKAEFEAAFEQIDYKVAPELFTSHVKTGNTNRDYVFQFTKELTSVITRQLKETARNVLEMQLSGMKTYWQAEEEKLTLALEPFQKIEQYIQTIGSIKKQYQEITAKVARIEAEIDDKGKFEQQIKQTFNMDFPKEKSNSFANITLPTESVIDTNWETEEQKTNSSFSEAEAAAWLSTLKKQLTQYQDKKLLAPERTQLLERIARYDQKTFIISLFGAFSAGKSSFANALLGQAILPVSPNPTTATINTVKRSEEGHPSGTALVFTKSVTQLEEEIRAVSEQLEEKLTIASLKKWKPKKDAYVSSWQKTYADYLLTLKTSLIETDWEFGSYFSVSHVDLKELIAEESKACLLEKVDIFYDCPITEQGIMLVDTPGVNSIHGRHTNVAFQQLRSSDAIFYLTYYNHAFSKADQYFLSQMAKVNESYNTDKLYFVINASDLAGSKSELNGVRKHVYDQLLRNGVNAPRLYDLSSKEGLEAKLKGTTEETSFAAFEKSFYEHTILELKQLSIQTIQEQAARLVEKMEDSIRFIHSESSKQEAKLQELEQAVSRLKHEVKESSFSEVKRDVLAEQEELTLYLRERVKFVLLDYFPHTINVATITANSKRAQHEELVTAIKEWRSFGEYFIKQELEATMIRLEQKLSKRAAKWVEDELRELQKELPYVHCQTDIEVESISLPMDEPLIPIDASSFTSYFKSKRDFFEQGTIKKLKEELVSNGAALASESIKGITSTVLDQVEKQSSALETALKSDFYVALDEEVNRFKTMLDKSEQQSLEQEVKQLAGIVK